MVSQLSMKIDILEFQSFEHNVEFIHKFTPFQSELPPDNGPETRIDPAEYDTVIVPAVEEGFKREFIENHCWWQIRISSAMLGRIKYIAAYQTAPISAVTHVAEVARIEKYKDTGKYIVYFKDAPKEIGPLKLTEKRKGNAPQGPRYTSYSRLVRAKTFEEIFRR